MPKPKDTFQVNIRPTRQLMARLDELSKIFKRDSGNQVAVEILEEYVELWAEAEQAKRDTITRQQEAMKRAIQAEMLKFPIRTAQTESSKPKAQKKVR